MAHPTDINSEPPSLPRAVNLDEPQIKTRPPRRIEYAHGDDSLESAIQQVEDELHLYAPKAPEREPMPDYVEPRENVPPVGALSAEALVKDYEKTAKHIEGLATELNAMAQQCASELASFNTHFGAVAIEIENVVSHIRQTATLYREEAKGVFQRIEDTALRMQEVRDLSAAMREKLVPTVSDPRLPTVSFEQLSGDRDLDNRTDGDRIDERDRGERTDP